MRYSVIFRGAVVTAVVLFVGWAGFAQVKDKSTDKSPPQPKKELPKPNSDSGKKTAPAAASTDRKPSEERTKEGAADAADEAAIRKGAVAFVEAYNAHDAKAISELFALKAEITDEEGSLVKGRDAISQDFAAMFEKFPKSTIKIEIDNIRILTTNIAVEEGLVRGQPEPEEPENVSSYVAVHVKVDGRWLIASVKDYVADSDLLTANDRLQELAWLVGDWIEESPDTIVHSVVKWHDNNNFLMQEFKVQIEGRVAMSGTMRIGWDAVRKQFRSWVFDSLGGFAEGTWLNNGDEWIVKSEGSTAAGEAAAATNVYRFIDPETIGWRSYDRTIDGERQDDIEEIVMKRRPPQPLQ